MINPHLLIDAVKQQMQPVGRAQHMAEMLQELLALTPDGVTLGDLAVGWEFLGHPQSDDETGAIAHRRDLCAKLAAIATPLADEPGTRVGAAKAWQVWHDTFQNSADPRMTAMAKIFVREISELQMAQM
jgi:hypothetical protein